MQKQENIEFPLGSVPIAVVSKIYGKNPIWIRAGIINGWLHIGFAVRNGEKITDAKEMNSRKGRINYYINPRLLYEETGYLWDGKEGVTDAYHYSKIQRK